MDPDDAVRGDRIVLFLESIKFSHSVFALPFAVIAMVLAAHGWPGSWKTFWIVVACVGARTAAMAFNRVADADFDARNPRTAGRALVTGALSVQFMMGALIVASLTFFLAAAMLNETCLYLAPPVLAILFAYSYAKRVTDWSHLVLGFALGLAPIGAWLAVRESISLVPLLLSIAVICWVAGFDMIYSCQDVEVDKTEKELHSIPKKLGVAGALAMARRVHVASLIFFALFWLAADLGILSGLGVIAIGALMEHQHRLVNPRDLSRVDAAFFTANGIISVGFMLVVIFDISFFR
ncbi:UbiA family prenyltransferase [Candidatus Sumerlaeota bacterium]|nr:UbiA family prenyltransferase [Candidatus Sumerlaeota bacterium]